MSQSKDKGTAWESEVARVLREAGWTQAERRSLNGSRDLGDITGVDPGIVIECKNEKRQDLALWVNEAGAERDNAGAKVGVVWHHRKGKSSPLEGYVTMSGADFLTLLAAWCEL